MESSVSEVRVLNHVGHSDKWMAGAGGGIIAQLLTYPLQTVNTRQQTERDIKRGKRKLGTIEHMCQRERLYGGLAPSRWNRGVTCDIFLICILCVEVLGKRLNSEQQSHRHFFLELWLNLEQQSQLILSWL
ncbi:hypothetical protein YC2023_078426 [Brassica napus]